MVAPSGEQYEIRAGGYAAVLTEAGATLRSLTHRGRPLVDGFAVGERSLGGRGQLLMPWPNRIGGGRYEFAGTTHQLGLSEPSRGNAIHGLARWAPWRATGHDAGSVSLTCRLMAQPGYPWTVDLQVEHRLCSDGLTVTQTATNRSDAPAPFACGAHPYLRASAGTVDDWELLLPATTRLLVDDRGLPTGRESVPGTSYDFRSGGPLRDAVLDHAFTDLVRGPDGRATVEVRDPETGVGAALWCDPRLAWLQVYTGDDAGTSARQALAVEPMSAPPDAFGSGEDLTVLAPAGSPAATWSASWGIRAVP